MKKNNILLVICIIAFGLIGAITGVGLGYLKYGSIFWSKSIYDLTFGFGPLIESMSERGSYQFTVGECGISFSAARLPVHPFTLYLISHLSSKLWFSFALKNFIASILYSSALYPICRRYDKTYLVWSLSVIATFSLPLVAAHATAVEYEEGLIYFLVSAAFAALISSPNSSKSMWAVSLLSISLAFLKSSLLATSTIFVFICCFNLYRLENRNFYLPALVYISALLLWGITFAGPHNGLAVGSSMSSWNGVNLYKGNNPKTNQVYPGGSLDALEGSFLGWDHDLEGNCFDSEWEANAYYLDKAWMYIGSHPVESVRRWLSRTYLAFLEVRDWDGGGSLPTWPSLVVIRILFFWALSLSFKSLYNQDDLILPSVLYITASMAYMAPYVLGFVYPRHVVVLNAFSLPYLLYYYCGQFGALLEFARD